MFRGLAEHLAPAPIQADGQCVCSDNAGPLCVAAPAAVAALLQETQLRCCCRKKKKLISVDSAEENQELACLLRWEPTAQTAVELVRGAEGGGNCAVSAAHDENRCFLFSLDSFVRIRGPNGSWRRRGASKTQRSRRLSRKSQVQLERVSPTSHWSCRCAAEGRDTSLPEREIKAQKPPAQSTKTARSKHKNHQINAHHRNATSDQLQDLGRHVHTCVLPL